jgi:hypothetical protein
MRAKKFTTKLESGFIRLPFDVREEFGRARPPVKVSINGHRYRSTVSAYGGKYFIPVRKSNQQAAGVAPGDAVTARVVLDTEKRTVEPAPELKAVFQKNAAVRANWLKLSYTAKKERADAIVQAKSPETRASRVNKIVAQLAAAAEQLPATLTIGAGKRRLLSDPSLNRSTVQRAEGGVSIGASAVPSQR